MVALKKMTEPSLSNRYPTPAFQVSETLEEKPIPIPLGPGSSSDGLEEVLQALLDAGRSSEDVE